MPATNKPLLWGGDLYKGWFFNKTDKNALSTIYETFPFQMLSLEEKTNEWVQAVADHYEIIGWNNVLRRQKKINQNTWLRYGKLNPTDYIVNPSENEYYEAINIINCGLEGNPLQMFYPLIPNIVDLLKGEFIKRDKSFDVEQVDQYAVIELLQDKEKKLRDVIFSAALQKKQMELSSLGINPDESNEEMMKQYLQEMESKKRELSKIEGEVKNFRTVGAKWAKKVCKIQEKKYNLEELEAEQFEQMLMHDAEFWELDMKEDDFKLKALNKKFCDWHKGPNIKYVSDGNYFLHFDYMSVGDIIDADGKDLKPDDLEKLKHCYNKMVSSVVTTDYQRTGQNQPAHYYDTSKPYTESVQLNPRLNDALLAKELVSSFPQTGNFQHSGYDTNIFDAPNPSNRFKGEPQMFRRMTLYWKSLKRIGWLTKIDRDGKIGYQDWVDENFKVTVEPVYDNSLIKEKSKKNLIYGEHIDWEWVNEWRKVIKISANHTASYWQSNDPISAIYLDGKPCPFQFKGDGNPYDVKPPIEGCEFTYLNASSHSLVDRLKPFQILYNIALNKVPKAFLNDFGPKLAIDKRSIPRNNKGLQGETDLFASYEDRIANGFILPYEFSRETLEGLGQPALPQVINMTTVDQSQAYLAIGQTIKAMAGETVGITMQRMGQPKASETAYGIQQSINYSESQTEKYFQDHTNLMKRVRQRMLDAAQYYSTFKETSQEMYMNEMEETQLLQIEGMRNLLPTYNIRLVSNANQRELKKLLTDFFINENTLAIRPGEKIEAIVSNSIPQMLEAIKRGDLVAEKMEQEKREAEERQYQGQIASNERIESEKVKADTEKTDKLIEKDLEVARIRALGGLQSDNNKNGSLDANENLNSYFKQQQLEEQSRYNSESLSLDKSKHKDTINLEREKLLSKEIIEQKKLAASLANGSKSDDKSLNKKIAKSQGVTKK